MNFNPSGQSSAHKGSSTEILKTAVLTDDIPEQVFVIGIEPEILKTGIGISDSVKKSFPKAISEILKILKNNQY